MKRLVSLALFAVLLLSASSAAAVTVSGRAGADSWSITTGTGGQLVLTLYWKTRNALMFMRGTCDDGAMFVSGSMQDRFQRVEIGVDPGTTCNIDIISRRGSSKYYLNVQGTGVFGARTPNLDVEKVRRARDRGARPPAENADPGTRAKSR